MVIELLVGHGGGGELQGCEEYCVACQEEARCSDARPRRPQGAAPGRVGRAHSILKPGAPKKVPRRACGSCIEGASALPASASSAVLQQATITNMPSSDGLYG